jgi:hypothetical protein
MTCYFISVFTYKIFIYISSSYILKYIRILQPLTIKVKRAV